MPRLEFCAVCEEIVWFESQEYVVLPSEECVHAKCYERQRREESQG